MANEQVVIEFIAEDGSIKRTFGNIKKEGEDSSGVLSELFNSSAVKIVGSIAAIGLTLKKSLDLTLEGERLQALEKQFDILSERAGISSDVLVVGLQKSSAGLVNMSSLLEISSGAMVTLGKNAQKLPEILEVARKSANVFGGDTKERFQEILFAIESGNQRALKHAGIILDVEKVYRNFGASLGKAASDLTVTERQTALLNATLERSKVAFAGVNTEATPATNAITRFKVAMNELIEENGKRFSETFGPAIAKVFNAITNAISPEKVKSIHDLNKELADLNKQLSSASTENFGAGSEAGMIQFKIQALEKLIEKRKEEEIVKKQNNQNDKERLQETANSISVLDAFNASVNGFKSAMQNYRENAVKNFADIGRAAFLALGQGVGGAFAQLGKSLAQGKDAFKDFGNFFLGVLGQILVQLGTGMILQGIGFSASPITPGSGGPLIAAGAALATFGGILQGLSGESGSAGANAAGGGVAGGGPQAPVGGGNIPNVEAKPGTSISVHVEGNILDRRGTGLELVNIIQEAFDMQGATIVGLA